MKWPQLFKVAAIFVFMAKLFGAICSIGYLCRKQFASL